MKRILSIFIAAIMFISIPLSVDSVVRAGQNDLTANSNAVLLNTAYLSDSGNYTGVVIGDSIAQGSPYTDGRLYAVKGKVVDLNYQNANHTIAKGLETLLNIPIFNHGVSGQITSQIKKRWSRDVLAEEPLFGQVPATDTKTLDKKPDFVVIICGINDLMLPSVSAIDVENNLGAMIDSAVANNIKPIVFNLGVRTGLNSPDHVAQLTVLREINAWLSQKKTATETMTLIDFWSFSTVNDANSPNTSVIGDGLHPNANGYDQLAIKIYNEANLSVYAAPSPTPSPTPVPTATVKPTPKPTPAPVHVKSVKLNKTKLTLVKGKSYKLIAKVYPTNAKNRKLTWKSGSKAIATVNSTGMVKGIRRGTVNIYVYTVDGKKTAKCRVTVK
jgi:lysophospholipase L1-like esterase